MSCRFCLTDVKELFSPCLCCGTNAHIHRDCLSHWLKQNPELKCQTCNFKYDVQNYDIFILDCVLLSFCIEILIIGFWRTIILANVLYSYNLIVCSQLPFVLFHILKNDKYWKRNLFFIIIFSIIITCFISWLSTVFHKASLYDDAYMRQNKTISMKNEFEVTFGMKLMLILFGWPAPIICIACGIEHWYTNHLADQIIDIHEIKEKRKKFPLIWRLGFLLIILMSSFKAYYNFCSEALALN